MFVGYVRLNLRTVRTFLLSALAMSFQFRLIVSLAIVSHHRPCCYACFPRLHRPRFHPSPRRTLLRVQRCQGFLPRTFFLILLRNGGSGIQSYMLAHVHAHVSCTNLIGRPPTLDPNLPLLRFPRVHHAQGKIDPI